MTVAERTVSLLLEGGDSALLRSIANAGVAGMWLSRLKRSDVRNIIFGVEISTGSDYTVRENARETLKRDLTKKELEQLSHDIWRVEFNCKQILETIGISFQGEGHSDYVLVGSAWIRNLIPDQVSGNYWVPQRNAIEMIIDGASEPLGTSSGSIHRYDRYKQLFSEVSDLGKNLLDISIRFFNTDDLQLETWEDLLLFQPQLWPAKLASAIGEKQLLDFNQIVGVKGSSGVFVSRVDGTPIYSARCPGCKSIHGNFRTWEEASGNRMCKSCVSDFVDMTNKANETGNYSKLLKRKRK